MRPWLISASLTINDRQVTPLPGWQITEDLEWCPTISAQVTVPASQVVGIDARTSPRAFLRVTRTYADDGEPGSNMSGEWSLIVRRVAIDHIADTAELTLESSDVLLMSTRSGNTNIDKALYLHEVITLVTSAFDPSGRLITGNSIGGTWRRLSQVTNEPVRWEPPETAAAFLSRVAALYDLQLLGSRNGLIVSRPPSNPELTIPRAEVLGVTEETDGGAYFNYAIQRHPDTHTELARVTEPAGSPRHWSTAGLRVFYLSEPWKATDKLRRALTRGKTWQVTAIDDYWLSAGTDVTVELPNGDTLVETVARVRHTAEGLMTLDFHPDL